MRTPFESRWLLAAASRLVPQPLRADWLREWEAEAWWWLNGHPHPRSLMARMRLAAHCSGGFADARRLRGEGESPFARMAAWVRTPRGCLAAPALPLAVVIAASGGLRQTRAAFREAPFPNAGRLATLSQTGPFMGQRLRIPAAWVDLWNAHSQALDGAAVFIPRRGSAAVVCRLKPGVTPQAAQAELRELIARAGLGAGGAWVAVTPLDRAPPSPAWLGLPLAAVLYALAGRRSGFRYRAFWTAKAALSLTALLLARIEFGGSLLGFEPGDGLLGAGALRLWLSLAAPGFALWWCWADQRKRCRSCLARLSMPAQMGYGARMLFETSGTELLCPKGHGRLWVSEGAVPHAEWTPLDATWSDLFPEGPA